MSPRIPIMFEEPEKDRGGGTGLRKDHTDHARVKQGHMAPHPGPHPPRDGGSVEPGRGSAGERAAAGPARPAGEPAAEPEQERVTPPQAAGAQHERTRQESLSPEELLDQYQRLKAEFANYKRRLEKERERDRARGAEDAIRKVLPARRLLVHAVETSREHAGAKVIGEGVALTLAELDKALAAIGIEPMKTVGEPFDPRFHEAVSMEPAPDGKAGTVLREVSPGYLKNGELFEPARVVVAG
jgi:molecular chaperone GrpE